MNDCPTFAHIKYKQQHASITLLAGLQLAITMRTTIAHRYIHTPSQPVKRNRLRYYSTVMYVMAYGMSCMSCISFFISSHASPWQPGQPGTFSCHPPRRWRPVSPSLSPPYHYSQGAPQPSDSACQAPGK